MVMAMDKEQLLNLILGLVLDMEMGLGLVMEMVGVSGVDLGVGLVLDMEMTRELKDNL
jgi:hypothetical protein